MKHNKASQFGQKLAVTFIAKAATKAPSSFCRCWRRYVIRGLGN
ncbi:hypothetical protein [Shewanella carassii]|nr:hypothetical protein [Shewanella carassii]